MARETTLEELRRRVADFVSRREWEPFHHPKDLAVALSVEAAELLELFQWRSREEVEARAESLKGPIAEELADVLIYALSLATALDLDLAEAVLRKLAANEERFPEDRFRGRAYG